jgi:hypothetical protein
MKTQILLKTVEHIYKCQTIEEIILAVLTQLAASLFELLHIRAMGIFQSLKFIIKALFFVKSTSPISPTFELTKQQ